MRQLVLVLLGGAALVAVSAAAPPAPAEAAEFVVPCNDDGLAHIPDLPEGARRPYSVRKRSRTVHRDADAAVAPDEAAATPQLPPGRRRFDAVLPDEQGHDITSSTARSQRSQRRLAQDVDDANEVAAVEPQVRLARPRKTVVVEENYPVNHPAFAEHNAKSDAVVDSYEKVRRYPTHLPAEDDDDNLESNDVVPGVPANDQVAQEDVPTASTDQRVDDAALDLPPGYRSKFPKRTFASDAGGSGDVLRVKPRKHSNQYTPQEHSQEQHPEPADAPAPTAPAPPQPQRRRPRPQPRPQPAVVEEEQPSQDDVADSAPREHQRFRASQRVRGDGGDRAQQLQLQQQQAPPQTPVRRRPRPQQQAEAVVAQVAEQEPQEQPQQRPQVRRRPRPRPETAVLEQTDAAAVTVAVDPENQVDSSYPAAVEGQPQRRPLRRRLRPRPTPPAAAAEEAEAPRAGTGQGRRRPQQQQQARTVSEESFQALQQSPPLRSRGHGRRLGTAAAAQNLPQVEAQQDNKGHGQGHEPSLVRSAVKKVPAGSHGGDPSPALIQKIVKNTLRRLQPQIAEHEGDVGVDILVKIIQVEDR
ncbi:hypothetical protein ONE63_006545 [Megalurothrips usitatus]|uniref:Serine/arginine repetitive matrix protein 1-like n=1 Tax=Megalurothrips usitatus TaxID=439358 RepID=A0AAV7Y0K5_9NEOP|nr:hypothetical protein ONE63_006545 [Megalurothrips usitatus]